MFNNVYRVQIMAYKRMNGVSKENDLCVLYKWLAYLLIVCNYPADKFQRALIEARVTSGVLQFSEPFPWLPNDKSLYVRSAYKEMYTILDHDGRNYMIVGSPGTGKSYFAIYVLYHALRASKTVVFHRSSESAVYLFKPGQKAQKGRENNCTIQALNLSETLYLYDAATKKNPSISPEASRLIVFSSPSPENTNDLRKLRLVSMHMPTWSIDELLLASELDHYRGRITETIIKDLYEKFGGIPRYVLEVEEERKEEYMCLLESNIHDCNLRTIQRVGREDIGKESHMIFHRYSGPDNYYKYKIKFASQFVGDKVVKAIYEHGYDEMKAFVRRDDIPSVAASLRGWIFETIVHNELPNGGIYHVRKLSDNKEESRGLPKMKHTIFNKLEEAGIPHLSSSEYMYLQPKSKTFEAADAILPPNNIFQVTVSTCHFIKANGLKNILKELKKHRDWRSDTRVNYFFVVPPDVYTSFSREQNYHTANNSKVSKSDDFEIVDQYVLEFTF